MNQEYADRLADSWLNAWNSRDISRIMSHYDENIEFISPFIQALTVHADGRIYGKAALERYFLKGLAKYPELHFRLLHVLPGVSGFTLVYRSVNNLLAAETMEIGDEGRVVRVTAHYSAINDHR